MKNPQLLKMKTNSSRQPRRCWHQNTNGTHCQANPQRGSQYCFFHDPDPAAQQKTAEARRAGGVIRSRSIEAEAAPMLPPNLPLLSLKTPAAVAGLGAESLELLYHLASTPPPHYLINLTAPQIRLAAWNMEANWEASSLEASVTR